MTAIARIDMKIDLETKLLAERVASLKGQTLSGYILSLIRQDAPQVIEQQQRLQLSNQAFDSFMQACQNSDWQSTDTLRRYAQQLDNQGVAWR